MNKKKKKKNINGEKESFQVEKFERVLLNESIEENFKLREILISRKKEMKINFFQIEKMRMNSLFIKNEKNKEKNTIKYIKLFSDIKESLLNESDILDVGVEVEILPFGKFEFENEFAISDNKQEISQKKRCLDSDENIFVYQGKKKIKNKKFKI